MNNYCRNCGEKLENDITVCPKCNCEVLDGRINVEEKREELKYFRKKEFDYILSIIFLYLMAFLISNTEAYGYDPFLSFIVPLMTLGATVLLVYAKFSMKKSFIINLLYKVFILLILAYFIYIIYLMMACTGVFHRGCF